MGESYSVDIMSCEHFFFPVIVEMDSSSAQEGN